MIEFLSTEASRALLPLPAARAGPFKVSYRRDDISRTVNPMPERACTYIVLFAPPSTFVAVLIEAGGR